MTRDEILKRFDQAFGVGKYPRGAAIALGEELLGAGRREAGRALLGADVKPQAKFKGVRRGLWHVYGDSVSEVAKGLIEGDEDGYTAYAILNAESGNIEWKRDRIRARESLIELYLLAGLRDADQS